MAKENGRNDSVQSVLAPLFALGQSTLEEIDHQGERWLDYAAAQTAESFRVARGVRSQLVGAAATLLATAGHMTTRSLDAAKAWTAPFGANNPFAAAASAVSTAASQAAAQAAGSAKA
jgi:hypothetical protein